MRYLKTLSFIAIAIASLTPSYGNKIPWRQKTTFQFAQDVELTEFLRGFASLQGISTVIDPDISGTVNGKFADIPPEEFLDRVSRAHGLTWFYDGNILYIYPAQKTESKFIEINDLAATRLLETVSNLGMIAPTSSIRMLGNGGIAFVSGPPKYVEIVSDMADRLSRNLRINYSTAPKIKIFPLQYAWAYDTSFNTQETSVTIPGIATVLRGLMDTGTNVSPDVIVSGNRTSNKVQVSRKSNTFKRKNLLDDQHNRDLKTSNKAENDRKKDEEKENQSNASQEDMSPVAVGATLIQPDMRLNAIIVRDVEEKMSQYEEIIKALDVPVQIVEIAVTILDVNTNYSSALGNKFFSYTSPNASGRNFAISPAGNDTTALTSAFNLSGGAVVNGAQILSQVQALSSDGHASILARPSILTLNNIEAEISKTQTFFVALTGKDSSDLANVSTSTKLRVTPRVIEGPHSHVNKIKLLVSIDDGSFDAGSTNTQVNGLPITSNDSINTQAVINEGQSLLVGGYYRQNETQSESGVPILRHIPLLGYIFKSKTVSTDTVERMFLITPRIINLNYETGPDISKQIAKLKKPPYGIAHQTSARNFRLRHKHHNHQRLNPDPKHHSPYHYGYTPHPKRPHYFYTTPPPSNNYSYKHLHKSSSDEDCCYANEQVHNVCVDD